MGERRLNKAKLILIRKDECTHELRCNLCNQEVYECSNKDCCCTLTNGEDIFCEPEAMPWVKPYCEDCGKKEKK